MVSDNREGRRSTGLREDIEAGRTTPKPRPPHHHTFSVQLDVNADYGRDDVYPPEHVLDVSVSGDVVFLQHCKYDETHDTSTLTHDGPSMAVDLRALLYALASQAPVDFALVAGVVR